VRSVNPDMAIILDSMVNRRTTDVGHWIKD